MKPYPIIKRLADFIMALSALLVFSPVILALCVCALIFQGRPIFFSQIRAGKDGKPFRLYKFRSMADKRDENGELLPSARRITKFGKFLRETSLDELPQLFCMLKGDMSLVGPRPLLMEYLPLYTKEQYKRMTVPQGLTGWAQVKGRNSLVWSKKFEFDSYYADHASLLFDLKIIFLTFRKLVKSKDNRTMDLYLEEVDDLGFWDAIRKDKK